METYLCDRLRIQKRGGQRPDVWIHNGMFLVHSRSLAEAPPSPPYTYDTRGRPFWLIDYVFDPSSSMVVPQGLNMINNPVSTKARLHLPVFFYSKRGGLGVTVSAAAASSTPGVLGEETIFEPTRAVSSTHFVLQVSSYARQDGIELTKVHSGQDTVSSRNRARQRYQTRRNLSQSAASCITSGSS